ncbi:hypothetical protein VYI99_08790 [Vibrio cholerae]|uniref:hypothetical protein n=1 Tax=Vibrio cholerae TaxID=666 RepID=UPI002E382259|nr:hypothetical protein [Vibrio cholerae]MED7816351.1 hypothetical protein [Vibrio cholerae]
MNKKIVIISSLIASSLSMPIMVAAAPSNGNLSFTFSGNIPSLPSDGGSWGFFAADGITPYVAPSSITLSAIDTPDGVRLTSTSESFYIKPKTGSFTANSKITAIMVAAPTIAGTAVQPGKANTVNVSVTLNGIEVSVGTSTDIFDNLSVGADAQRLTLGSVIDVPTEARTASGGDIRVGASIRFAADIT